MVNRYRILSARRKHIIAWSPQCVRSHFIRRLQSYRKLIVSKSYWHRHLWSVSKSSLKSCPVWPLQVLPVQSMLQSWIIQWHHRRWCPWLLW